MEDLVTWHEIAVLVTVLTVLDLVRPQLVRMVLAEEDFDGTPLILEVVVHSDVSLEAHPDFRIGVAVDHILPALLGPIHGLILDLPDTGLILDVPDISPIHTSRTVVLIRDVVIHNDPAINRILRAPDFVSHVHPLSEHRQHHHVPLPRWIERR